NKIEMPPGTAEFPVGDRLQADFLLLPDHPFDLAIFDFLQLRGRHFTFGALLPCLFQRGGAQQAADMGGTERRLGTLHLLTLRKFTSAAKKLSPRLPPQLLQSSAVSPTARLRRGYCLLRWRRSRIAATGKAAPWIRISQPRRCAA